MDDGEIVEGPQYARARETRREQKASAIGWSLLNRPPGRLVCGENDFCTLHYYTLCSTVPIVEQCGISWTITTRRYLFVQACTREHLATMKHDRGKNDDILQRRAISCRKHWAPCLLATHTYIHGTCQYRVRQKNNASVTWRLTIELFHCVAARQLADLYDICRLKI